jgi:hypothetical protein
VKGILPEKPVELLKCLKRVPENKPSAPSKLGGDRVFIRDRNYLIT